MNRFLYRLMYWLGMSHWDSGETPSEVQEAFQAGGIPPGAALGVTETGSFLKWLVLCATVGMLKTPFQESCHAE